MFKQRERRERGGKLGFLLLLGLKSKEEKHSFFVDSNSDFFFCAAHVLLPRGSAHA